MFSRIRPTQSNSISFVNVHLNIAGGFLFNLETPGGYLRYLKRKYKYIDTFWYNNLSAGVFWVNSIVCGDKEYSQNE